MAKNVEQKAELTTLLDRLFSRINYERKEQASTIGMKTDGIRELLGFLDNPHLAYSVVHVAGTKGKGSVTKLSAAILNRSGYRAGAYTSPHLVNFHERISIQGRPIDDEALTICLKTIFSAIDENAAEVWCKRLTFFDIATAVGFLAFRNAGLDVAVVEVGLGGRLDSTNVCRPSVCVITNISFDHTRQLGKTLASIACEKGGIIKNGIPLVSGVVDAEPRNEIVRIALENQSPLYELNRQISCENVRLFPGRTLFDLTIHFGESTEVLHDLETRLLGRHQVDNAALAIMALKLLESRNPKFKINNATVRASLAEFEHMGRIEFLSHHPLVVVDVAHNVASMQALIQTLQDQVPLWNSARTKTLILSISRDKDQADILRVLLPHFDQIVITQFVNNPRATACADLLAMAQPIRDQFNYSIQFHTEPDPLKAWKNVHSSLGPNDVCCVAGSLFLVGELKQKIEADLAECSRELR